MSEEKNQEKEYPCPSCETDKPEFRQPCPECGYEDKTIDESYRK